MEQANNQLEAKININKFPANTVKYYELDTDQDWVKDLLVELNEKVDEISEEDKLAKTSISIDLEIEKKFKQEYGDYLLVRGSLKSEYVTQCIRTLEEMDDSIELEIKSAFIAGHLEKTEEFQEVMDIYDSNEVYELYYFQKGQADVSEMIHEQVFLNINQYPVKDEEAPLPESGTKH